MNLASFLPAISHLRIVATGLCSLFLVACEKYRARDNHRDIGRRTFGIFPVHLPTEEVAQYAHDRRT